MDEPPVWLQLVMFHFAGGDAWWVALAAMAGTLACLWPRAEGRAGRRWRLAAACLFVVGVSWGVCSGEPALYWLGGGVVLAALVAGCGQVSKWRTASLVGRAGVLVGGAGLLGLFVLAVLHRVDHVDRTPPGGAGTLCVVGDSVTAGLNDGDDTWPRQLARASGWRIIDASQPGATVRSAQEQLDVLDGANGLYLLEIGGNDILGETNLADYALRLDSLLGRLKGRPVVLLELPWPPLAQPFARVHRELAARYGARLVPRRQFMKILTTRGATYDSIHLTNAGHTLFCDWIRGLLAGEPTTLGRYEKLERKRIGDALDAPTEEATPPSGRAE